MHAVETMFSYRARPWHGLGIVCQEAPNSEEALKISGLDWQVVKTPVKVNEEVVPGYWANVRDMDNKVLGIVGDKYKIVQNKEAFAFVDNLLGEGLTFETAGSLFGGKKVWMMAQLPNKYTAADDKIAPYVAFVNSHDGSGAIRVIVTPVRIVCNNTLNLALLDAKRTWTCIHTGDVSSKLHEAKKTLLLAEDYMEKFVREAAMLAKKKLYNDQVEKFIQELLPIPDDAGAIKENNILELRDSLKLRYNYAPDLKRLEGSGWRFINAVSDFATHSEPKRKTDTFNENRFDGILSGNALIDKAYELLKSA